MKTNRRTGTYRIFAAVLTAVFAFVLTSAGSIAVYAYSATDLPAGEPNLEAALEEYGASPNDVIYVDTAGDIATALKRAERIAEDSRRVIVYLPPGTYRISGHINVPENVVLVAEDDSLVTPSGSDSYLVRLSGSMYGGTYDSNYKNQTTIRILETYGSFSNGNGQIENLSVLRSSNYGIVAQGSKGSKISKCTVRECKASGIAILKPSSDSGAGATQVESIKDCNISSNGEKGEGAGIHLYMADVGTIASCILNSNSDKAVSTNSSNSSGCHIGTIKNCTMKKNGNNGVHIKPNCRLDHFVNNTLIGNDDGLVAAAITKEGTKGKSIIKDVRGNTFKQSVTQQIEAQGSGASITLGDGNTIVSGKGYGILVMKYGKVTVSGSNNIIKSNDKGIGAQSHGSVIVTGKKNQILSNKKYGIQAVTKAVISITGSGNKISGNGKSAVYSASRAKITLKKVKVSGLIYKTGGGKVVKK